MDNKFDVLLQLKPLGSVLGSTATILVYAAIGLVLIYYNLNSALIYFAIIISNIIIIYITLKYFHTGIKEINIKKIGDRIEEIFEIDNKLFDIFSRRTIHTSFEIYGSRGKFIRQFYSFIKDANRIYLLDVSIYDFLDYEEEDHESRIIELIENGVEFHILVMDPNYNESDVVTKIRYNQQSRIRACNDLMNKFKEFRTKESFQIRTYQDNPNSFLLITDNSIYMSPYLRQKASNDYVPYVKIDPSEKELINSYNTHFLRIWNDKDNTESIWYVFSWHEIPGEHNEQLKEFLIKYCNNNISHKIDWVKNAIIEKTDNKKMIMLSLGESSLSIELNDDVNKATEATAEANGNQIAKFKVKKHGDKLKLYWA
jgi:hypothetical protein